MTYYGGPELAASFRTVRTHTIRIAEDIPEEKYSFSAAPGARSIGQTLAHIAHLPMLQMHVHQNAIDDLKTVNFPDLMQRMTAAEAEPWTKSEVLSLLHGEGENFAAFLEALDEAFLAQRVGMPPGVEPATKSRFEMLLSPKEHEMHHRGQLMMLQRMIGITPHLTRQMQERLARAAQQGQR